MQQAVPEFRRPHKHLWLLKSLETDEYLVRKGRHMLHLPQPNLQIVKPVVVLSGRQLNQLVVWDHGLQNGLAREAAPACPAHHLGQHIKGGLPRPEASGEKAQVRIQNAHQGHIWHIQSLGHHLGAQQNLLLSPAEPVQNRLVGIAGADGVRIHAGHLHVREQRAQLLLHPLGSRAQGFQGTAAAGAAVRHRNRIAAVVAQKAVVGAVIGQPFAAPGALRRLPAVYAHQGAAIATAVEKQDRLLVCRQGIVNGLAQRDAQCAVVAQLQLLAHIHDLRLRQRAAIVAVLQPIEPVMALLCMVHAFHGRGG